MNKGFDPLKQLMPIKGESKPQEQGGENALTKTTPEVKSERISLVVTPSFKEDVQRIAAKYDLSANELIIRATTEYLKTIGEL